MAQLGAKPTLQHFQEIVMNLPKKKRSGFIKDIFGLAFSEWRNLNVAYRIFFVELIKNERQQFLDFVRMDTILGEFLYDVRDEDLFIKILNLLEFPDNKQKTGCMGLSFSLLLGFNMDFQVKSLSNKIRYARVEMIDLCELLEKRTIE